MCKFKKRRLGQTCLFEDTLTVCGIYILETALSYSYVKQFSDPLMEESNHDYNTRLNRQVKPHHLEIFMKKQNLCVQNRFTNYREIFYWNII